MLLVPASITDMYDAFGYRGGSSLEEVVVDPENPVYASKNNMLINTKTGTLIKGVTDEH